MKFKFKNQLIVSFVIIIFVVLTICLSVFYKTSFELLSAQSEQMTINKFHQNEYNMTTFINEVDRISKNIILSLSSQDLEKIYSADESENVIATNQILDSLSQPIINYEYIKSIYFIDDLGKIIGSTMSSSDIIKPHELSFWFLNEELYKKALNSSNVPCWGQSYIEGKTNQLIPYISVARKVNVQHKGQKYMLLLNLKEDKISPIFANKQSYQDIETSESVLMLDEHGKVLSTSNKERLGSSVGYFDMIRNNTSEYGSLSLKDSGEEKQIVYYKMNEMGWYFVNETPLNQVIGDVPILLKSALILFLVGLIGALLGASYWIYRITRPMNDLLNKIKLIQQGRLGIELDEMPKNELGDLGKQFNKMSRNIQSLMNQTKQIESEKRKYEIEALQSQINPHFIYNSLNTIKWMGMLVKADNIVDSITALGDIIKPIFRNKTQFSTIAEELSYAKSFIKIMNYRYGETISLDIDVPKHIYSHKVPRFIIQPLVENSVLYGFGHKQYVGNIIISIKENLDEIIITIWDDGIGMSQSQLEEFNESLKTTSNHLHISRGIGCKNINQRICLHYGDKYGIVASSKEGEWTRMELTCPKKKEYH